MTGVYSRSHLEVQKTGEVNALTWDKCHFLLSRRMVLNHLPNGSQSTPSRTESQVPIAVIHFYPYAVGFSLFPAQSLHALT